MSKEKSEQLFDLRTLELLLREGKFTQKEYESYLKSLPDAGSNADYIEVYEEPSPEQETEQEGNLAFSMADSNS